MLAGIQFHTYLGFGPVNTEFLQRFIFNSPQQQEVIGSPEPPLTQQAFSTPAMGIIEAWLHGPYLSGYNAETTRYRGSLNLFPEYLIRRLAQGGTVMHATATQCGRPFPHRLPQQGSHQEGGGHWLVDCNTNIRVSHGFFDQGADHRLPRPAFLLQYREQGESEPEAL